MLIYDYDPFTNEYIGSREARILPGREGLSNADQSKYQISEHATTIAPPEPTTGMARVFRNGAWEFIEDHRGETWWRAYKQPVEITTLGGEKGLYETEPAKPPPTEAELRLDSFVTDTDYADLLGRLKAATPAQVKSYINANVTDLASARALLVKITLLLTMLAAR